MFSDAGNWSPKISATRLLLPEKSVESSLSDGLVDFRLCTTGRNSAQDLTVDLDGKSALIREVIRKSKHFEVSLLQCVGRVLCRHPVEGGVARLFLRPHNGVDGGCIRLLQKKQVAAFVDNADRDLDMESL